MNHRIYSTVIAILAASQMATAQAEYKKPSSIPVEAFAALSTFNNAKLAPSGKNLAYVTSEDGRNMLMVHSLDGGPSYSIPPQERSEIKDFYWINEEIILLKLYMVWNRLEFNGAVSEIHLMAYNLKTHKVKWLGKPEKASLTRSTLAQRTPQVERIVDLLPNDPERVLLAFDFELDGKTEVYRTNVYNGRRRLDKTGNDGVQQWFSDHQGEVRLGVGFKIEGFGDAGKPFAMLKGADNIWKDLERADWYKTYNVRNFTADPNVIYVSGTNQFGTTGLYTLDLRTGEITGDVFVQKGANFDHLITEKKTKKVIGVAYTDTAEHVKYFDPFYAGLQTNLNKAFAGSNNKIVNKATAAERYVILSHNSQNPGTYYLYDKDKGQLSALSNVRDDMPTALMASVSAVQIPVRDGSHIEGFLTKPSNWTAGQKVPFIIFPHGGPETHDNADWNWWVQFYASRGYGVLQPNFRGSTGYGKAFQDAGILQWGGLMQDDVTDATNWLISEGLADAKRICIVGASYGGYAALMGAVKEPDLYQCAISVNGVSNLPSMKERDKRFIGGKNGITDMGLEGAPDKSVSPYHLAEKITIPILLIAAKDDARVAQDQSKDMHKRLKKLKKKSKFIGIKTGAHYLQTAPARLKVLKATEKFLAEHIGR